MEKLKILILLAISGLWAASGFAQTIVETHGKLHVDGRFIKDECGRIAQLKGPSYFHHTWEGNEFFNKDAVGWLASDWKAEIVRATMAADPHVDGSYPDDPTYALSKIRPVIEGAIEHGIYVIIDWHAHASQVEAAKAFFSMMAQDYGSYPNVLYEIYNEPTGSSWDNLDQDWAHLKDYSRKVIAEIREHDPDNIIICPTPFYDQFVHHAADDPLTTDINGNPVGNVVYTLHVYADAHKFDGSQGDWAKEALSKGLPMFVTESGATGTQYNEPRETGINAPNYTEWNKWETWWDDNGISFCKWSLSTKNEFGSSLNPGAPANGGWDYWTDLTDEGRWNRDHFRAVNVNPGSCDPGVDDISAVSGPSSVEQGGTATVTITYEASANRDIQVVLQLNESPWTSYGSKKVDVSAGSGSVNVTVPVNASIPVASNAYKYQCFITTDGGGWNERLDNMQQTGVSATSASSGETITVRAKMINGSSDNLQLRLNNNTVKTWTISGTSYANYTYTIDGTNNVKLYFPDNGTDMQIDYIKVGSTTYQSENQATNTSVWQGGSCGGSYSELMHCAGYIDFGSITAGAPSTKTITIRARGTCGTETMKLLINDSEVKTWNNLSTSFTNYSYSNYTSGNIKVAFTNDGNDGCDRNLVVDYIQVDGTTYQAESATRTGCGSGEWLWCNGNFDFGDLGSSLKNTSTLNQSPGFEDKNVFDDFIVYPNPACDVITIRGNGNYSLKLFNTNGQVLIHKNNINDNQTIDVRELNKGMYILKIQSQEKVITKQVIIE